MIDLYTAPTPNGHKISIMLEEVGLPWTLKSVDLQAAEQKTPEFLKLNPNGRVPAIYDHDAGFAVFESGAILLHLAERSGRLLPSAPAARSRTIQWLFWQNAGLGPMMGQLNVFQNYFPERLPAAIDRYLRESRRLLGVLEAVFAERAHVADEDYTIADIACWPWVALFTGPERSMEPFPRVAEWLARVGARPAVQRGRQLPPRRPPEKADEQLAVSRSLLV